MKYPEGIFEAELFSANFGSSCLFCFGKTVCAHETETNICEAMTNAERILVIFWCFIFMTLFLIFTEVTSNHSMTSAVPETKAVICSSFERLNWCDGKFKATKPVKLTDFSGNLTDEEFKQSVRQTMVGLVKKRRLIF